MRTVKDEWERYWQMFPKEDPPDDIQLVECRKAFYGGVLVALRLFQGDEERSRRLAECEAFEKGIQNGKYEHGEDD